jgi:hypothetical protein
LGKGDLSTLKNPAPLLSMFVKNIMRMIMFVHLFAMFMHMLMNEVHADQKLLIV